MIGSPAKAVRREIGDERRGPPLRRADSRRPTFPSSHAAIVSTDPSAPTGSRNASNSRCADSRDSKPPRRARRRPLEGNPGMFKTKYQDPCEVGTVYATTASYRGFNVRRDGFQCCILVTG